MDKRSVLGIFLIFLVLIVWSWLIVPRGQKKVESEKEAIKLPSKRATEEVSEKEAIKLPREGATGEGVAEVLDSVDTDLFCVVISRVGAGIKSIKLKEYKGPVGDWVELIPEGERALGGMIGEQIDLSAEVFDLVERTDKRLVYEFIRGKGDKRESSGNVRKVYEFEDGSYMFGLTVGGVGDRYKILWDSGLRTTEKNQEMELRYFGGVVRLGDATIFKGLNGLDTIPKGEQGNIGWVGAKNKYFLSAIVPLVETEGYTMKKVKPGRVGGGCMRGCMPAGEVDPEMLKVKVSLSTWSRGEHRYKVYVGPLDYDILKGAGYGLEDACYFGFKWIRPISRFFLKVILWLHRGIANYGLVIIVFSLMLSLIFFPLTKVSHKSAAGMQQLQPKLQELQKKYKRDPKRLQKATMELYRKQGVSPLSGCLPLLIQMPIFFALYAILDTTIALRGAVFIPGWIEDLSQHDPYYALPLMMGGMMFLQQKLQMRGAMGGQMGQQKMMMYMMPIIFTFIFLRFPSGLVLYWFVYNIFSFAQTYLIKASGANKVLEVPARGKERR